MDTEREIKILLNIRKALKDDNDLSIKVANFGCQSATCIIDDIITGILEADRDIRTYKFTAELHKDAIEEYMELVGDLEELDDEAREKIRNIVKEAHNDDD